MFTVQEILAATSGGLVQGSLRTRVRGVSIDSRTVRAGDIFVAVRGENFDGHRFLAQAAERGARAVVVRSGVKARLPEDVAVVAVEDTVKALGQIAGFYRARFRIPVVAITGSAGKTTTKQFIGAVLRTKFRVLCSKGTQNNHIGVPLTLLQLRKRHQVAVLELGTNHFGEIAWLASLVRPTVAVFTNIGQSHLAGLGSPEGVLREKATLLDFLAQNGAVVFNWDDPLLKRLARRKASRRIMGYAVEYEDAEVRAVSVEPRRGGLVFRLRNNADIFLKSPAWGNVYNALAAVACGQILKVSFKDMIRALESVKSARGRQYFFRAGGVTVIDDTYNSNPVSFRNALRSLSLIKKKGRIFVVAGDMLELGPETGAIHAVLGRTVAESCADTLFTLGRWAGRTGREAERISPSIEARHFQDQAEILSLLKRDVRPGDIVLVKASRGMCMENIVNGLVEDLKRRR